MSALRLHRRRPCGVAIHTLVDLINWPGNPQDSLRRGVGGGSPSPIGRLRGEPAPRPRRGVPLSRSDPARIPGRRPARRGSQPVSSPDGGPWAAHPSHSRSGGTRLAGRTAISGRLFGSPLARETPRVRRSARPRTGRRRHFRRGSRRAGVLTRSRPSAGPAGPLRP